MAERSASRLQAILACNEALVAAMAIFCATTSTMILLGFEDLPPLRLFLLIEAIILLAAAVFVLVYRVRLHAPATDEEARKRRAELREEEQPFEHSAVDPRPIGISPSIFGLIGGVALGLLLLIPLWGSWIGTAQLVGHAIIGFVAGRRLAH